MHPTCLTVLPLSLPVQVGVTAIEIKVARSALVPNCSTVYVSLLTVCDDWHEENILSTLCVRDYIRCHALGR